MHYYTAEEKLAHLDRAKAQVEKGEGSFASYARERGLARTTFQKWMRTYGYGYGKGKKGPDTGLVRLGNPLPLPSGGQRFVVEYYGSRIEVGSTGDLVELLKGIKKASSI